MKLLFFRPVLLPAVRLRSIAIALLFSAISSAGIAGTFYVSPAGNDEGPGSSTRPWGSIQKACETLEPGDTAIVRAGFYTEQVYVEVEGDAENGPVTLQAEGKVTVSAAGGQEENVFYLEDKSYVRIIGFEIRDLQTKDGSGIRFEGSGSHLEFRDNVIHTIRGKNAMGITVYGTNDETPVSDLVIAGNEIHNCDAAPSEALTLNGNVTDFRVENNFVHDVDGIGIDFIGGEKGVVDPSKVARNGLCRGNRVERARSGYGGGFGAGIYVDGGRDIVIEGNFVSECDLGIEIGAENKGTITTGIEVRSNVIANNDKAGIVMGGYNAKTGRVTDCRILNNLCRGNTGHKKAEGELWIQWASGNVIRNNLFIGRTGTARPLLVSWPKGQSNDLDYNLWFIPGGPGGEFQFIWEGREFSTLAAFSKATGLGQRSYPVDPKLAENGVHLTAGSPCLDAGDPETKLPAEARDFDGDPRVAGKAVDLGPDEFGGLNTSG